MVSVRNVHPSVSSGTIHHMKAGQMGTSFMRPCLMKCWESLFGQRRRILEKVQHMYYTFWTIPLAHGKCLCIGMNKSGVDLSRSRADVLVQLLGLATKSQTVTSILLIVELCGYVSETVTPVHYATWSGSLQ